MLRSTHRTHRTSQALTASCRAHALLHPAYFTILAPASVVGTHACQNQAGCKTWITRPLASRQQTDICTLTTHATQLQAALRQGCGHSLRDFDACRLEEGLGPETMTLLKKMRLLKRKGAEMEPKKVMEKTRKYLASVGDAVADLARAKGRTSTRNIERWRERLWEVC